MCNITNASAHWQCHSVLWLRSSQLSRIITHPLIFARFYWLLYVTWCKFTGRLSRNNPRLRRYLPSCNFHWKETKPAEKRKAQEFHLFIFIILHGRKTTRFVDVQSCLHQKAGRKCCSGKYKNVNKTCCQRLWRCRKLRVVSLCCYTFLVKRRKAKKKHIWRQRTLIDKGHRTKIEWFPSISSSSSFSFYSR